MDLSFFNGKRVFITGHTGFKGSWMCKILKMANASICGYSLSPLTHPSLFKEANIDHATQSVLGDIRDREHLKARVSEFQPDIIIHMAAQPLVRDSYDDPVYTYETNVMGTVNLLEAVRNSKSVKSVLNVTTDKVYLNREWAWGYRENEPLDGFDPYSNSKSCSELVTHSYKNSFFMDGRVAISTARSGNVLGGGDFSKDRIIPDCVRAAERRDKIIVRNPHSTRPYQHVLEPLIAYLMIVQKQYEDRKCADYYNVGPDEKDCITTGELAELFCRSWGEGLSWQTEYEVGPHEANFLKLDCSKLKSTIKWKPRWSVSDAVERTVEWTKVYFANGDVSDMMDRQIVEYLG
ncbi:CDP-glucose 4,6-dehydratase [Desulfosporosinus shakirovi]|uniref:CDP-glucose 4,6-dehydratase n=1 Tax=Desulfosporosinus shakirovi TaxID=2885154 RepID=UPI001E3B2C9A|nr:CDP-glucose 4,6-dehydratase [Desulfosporosinus sp. SRJS8]MCB8814152.1 CDP-glucose 4,6-dehydratase [Desulfosporosinus sp. SRJS8]